MDCTSKSFTTPSEDGLLTPKANWALKVLVCPCEKLEKLPTFSESY